MVSARRRNLREPQRGRDWTRGDVQSRLVTVALLVARLARFRRAGASDDTGGGRSSCPREARPTGGCRDRCGAVPRSLRC